MGRLTLREAMNFDQLTERDALVRRKRRIRARVIESKRIIEHWNRTHAREEHVDTAWEDAMLAWLDTDGVGPIPTVPTHTDGAE